MSYFEDLKDAFAQGFLEKRSPVFNTDRVTKWAKGRTQTKFNEEALALADSAADEFFQKHPVSYCFVTVIPKLESGRLHMSVITESGLSFEGLARSTGASIMNHLRPFRKHYKRKVC